MEDSIYLKYFGVVVDNLHLTIGPETQRLDVFLTHYPTNSIPERFNLVGHVHDTWKVQKNMLNVGVDVHHFQPISEMMVVELFNQINQRYDQDIWVGEHPSNTIHRYRGRPGSTKKP